MTTGSIFFSIGTFLLGGSLALVAMVFASIHDFAQMRQNALSAEQRASELQAWVKSNYLEIASANSSSWRCKECHAPLLISEKSTTVKHRPDCLIEALLTPPPHPRENMPNFRLFGVFPAR